MKSRSASFSFSGSDDNNQSGINNSLDVAMHDNDSDNLWWSSVTSDRSTGATDLNQANPTLNNEPSFSDLSFSDQEDNEWFTPNIVQPSPISLKRKLSSFDIEEDDLPQGSTPKKQRTDNKEFKGESADNYQGFFNYFKEKSSTSEKISNLGNISKHPAYYFDETEEIINFAKDFLSQVTSNQNSCDFLRKQHAIKFHDRGGKKLINPACISFISITISGKPFKFISLSNANDTPEVVEHLKGFIESYRHEGVKPTLLIGDIYNYNVLINKIKNTNDEDSDDNEDNRFNATTCSEKFFSSFLTKACLLHTSNLKITGALNCMLYPYSDHDIQNGNEEFGLKKPNTNGGVLELTPAIKTFKLPCCAHCKNVKESVIEALDIAQEKGQTSPTKIDLSPIKNSIGTLLSPNSKFSLFGSQFTPIKISSSSHPRNQSPRNDQSSTKRTLKFNF